MFYSFSYNGVYYDLFKLSVSDAIVIQKGSNGDGKQHIFFVNVSNKYKGKKCLSQKTLENVCKNECALMILTKGTIKKKNQRIYPPLFKKDAKQNQN